nr:hypothetical protein [Tanacetum cinerariifolium]
SAKGKRPLRATTIAEPTDLQRTEAEQLKRDDRSDKDSEETVKSGAVKESDEDNDEDDDNDDEEEETAKDDKESKETGKG